MGKTSFDLSGLGISEGIGYGTILQIKEPNRSIPDTQVESVEQELEHFETVYQAALDQTKQLQERVFLSGKQDAADIMEAHLAILEDSESLAEPIREYIRNGQYSAVRAIDLQLQQIADEFSHMKSELLRERAADILDIRNLLLDIALGNKQEDLSNLPADTVLVAEELVPSQTVGLDTAHVAAIIVAQGSVTSHIAIISRSFGIPTISGISDVFSILPNGASVIVDGTAGRIVVHPNKEQIKQAMDAMQHEAALLQHYEQFRMLPSVTKDGTKFAVYVNIATPEDLQRAIESTAEGIGLFRSEFLYMNRQTLPDEEEQYRAYRSVAAGFGGKEVIIRTMDIGGDKEVPALTLRKEENPFLGCRAIRLSLREKDLFKTQLRALLRAADGTGIKIMFPMISSIEELRAAKCTLEEAKSELAASHVPFNPSVPIGMMIEIPSSAVMSDVFAKEVDFFSIGTNDLTQYTVAVDRGNTELAALYSAYQPAVLRLIATTIRNAHAAGIPCGMCGEAASDAALIPLWIGLGLDEFSVSPNVVLKTRAVIANHVVSACEACAEQVLQQGSINGVLQALTV